MGICQNKSTKSSGWTGTIFNENMFEASPLSNTYDLASQQLLRDLNGLPPTTFKPEVHRSVFRFFHMQSKSRMSQTLFTLCK